MNEKCKLITPTPKKNAVDKWLIPFSKIKWLENLAVRLASISE